ncbi:MAG: hypothetical protein MK078_07750 [Crocinitomicaceae bacterium]|nr:hypothetical protein [Crocinitomicaceae bacterium]
MTLLSSNEGDIKKGLEYYFWDNLRMIPPETFFTLYSATKASSSTS